MDTLLLVYYVLDYGTVGTFVRSKGLPEPYWYRISFPYVLHPFKGLFIASSIFMVVAISAERHRAICSPLTHRPAFWPYAVMVFCVSSKYTTYIYQVQFRSLIDSLTPSRCLVTSAGGILLKARYLGASEVSFCRKI